MEGTPHHSDTIDVVDRFGRLTEGTRTREEWLQEHEGGEDDDVNVIRYHRDLLGAAA